MKKTNDDLIAEELALRYVAMFPFTLFCLIIGGFKFLLFPAYIWIVYVIIPIKKFIAPKKKIKEWKDRVEKCESMEEIENLKKEAHEELMYNELTEAFYWQKHRIEQKMRKPVVRTKYAEFRCYLDDPNMQNPKARKQINKSIARHKRKQEKKHIT